MAEDKKKAPPPPSANHMEEVVFLLAGLLILGVIVNRVLAFFNSPESSNLRGFWGKFLAWFIFFWPIWKIVVVILVIFSIALAIYSSFKLGEVISAEEKIFGKESDEAFLEEDSDVSVNKEENERWQRIFEHGNSNNSSDWRLAIIEGDIMLEEMLRSLGYQGDGVGEMLKSVDPSDMLTLDNAWEAHKVRNRIAHSGQDFQLTERETRRVLALFESVFREFRMI